MKKINFFDNISDLNISKIIKSYNGKSISFRKDRTVLSNMSKLSEFGLIVKGKANLIKYDINGNLEIVECLEENDLFGSIFSSIDDENLSLITVEDSELIFFNLDEILSIIIKQNNDAYNVVYNMLFILAFKKSKLNNRLDILTQRSIRDKLIKYFEIECSKKGKNTFNLQLSLTSLADFIAVDRSSMMRELKKLKNEGFIIIENKKVTINRY
ncbi:MAG: Crp/Fnr family transcriptional regulator [Bacilli bacterium]